MANDMPRAEFSAGADLVRALLSEQHPDLVRLPLTLLANGWDNLIMRLGSEFLVRLPRRELAARLVAHEQRWLPLIAPELPLPVPSPVRVGRPGSGYPWPWSITAYLSGEVAAVARFDAGQAARSLGRFLARLHRPAPGNAPVSAVRGVPLRERASAFARNLRLAGGAVDTAAASSLWQRAVAAEHWRAPPVWLHGDFHPANILVDRGRVSGVIDFGDITAGDPATDLAIAWMLLPREQRESFWDAYASDARHDVDPALTLRARGWALNLGMVFLAHSADNRVMHGIGQRAVAAVLE